MINLKLILTTKLLWVILASGFKLILFITGRCQMMTLLQEERRVLAVLQLAPYLLEKAKGQVIKSITAIAAVMISGMVCIHLKQ